MTSPLRHEFRLAVAVTLIPALLGLVAVDAEVCRGTDGHLGLDTRLGSCCDIAAPEAILAVCCASMAGNASNLVDAGVEEIDEGAPGTIHRHGTVALDPVRVGPSCVDAPLIHARPAAPSTGEFAAGADCVAIHPIPIDLASLRRGGAPLPRVESHPERLRTIPLLI